MDTAASHARMLRAATDDMFAAHSERAGRFSPMFDVQTAMEVLTTGVSSYVVNSLDNVRVGHRISGASDAYHMRWKSLYYSNGIDLKISLESCLLAV